MTNTLVSMVNDQPVLIEIDDSRVMRGIGSDLIAPAGKIVDALDSAKDTILSVTQKMVTAIRSADQAIAPDAFELTFSLKFTAEGQAFISKVGGEASLEVHMTYNKKTNGKTD